MESMDERMDEQQADTLPVQGSDSRGAEPRESIQRGAGNANERIEIVSGSLALIDQFLLSRPAESRPAPFTIKVSNGSYGVFRDPVIGYMVVHPMEHQLGSAVGEDASRAAEDVLEMVTEQARVGQLRIETRALVFLDSQRLSSEIGQEYSRIFRDGDHKGARDYLREHGGAVRYGFDRTSDVLEVFLIPNTNLIVLRRAHPN